MQNLSAPTSGAPSSSRPSCRDAQIYRKGKKGEEALGIDLGGSQVNADTCWPDDFLSTPDFATVRDEDLVRKAKIVQGQYLGKPSLGYACGLMPDSVLQVEAPTSQGLSLDKAATAFGVGTKRVVNALMGEEEVKPRPDRPDVCRPTLCRFSQDPSKARELGEGSLPTHRRPSGR